MNQNTIENSKEIKSVSEALAATQIEVSSIKTDSVRSIDKKANEQLQQIQHMQAILVRQAKILNQEGQKQTDYTKKHNLIFTGIREERGENCLQVIDQLIFNRLRLPGAFKEIDKAHRLGKYQKGKTRPIIVRFKTHHASEVTYSRRGMLDKSGMAIYHHVSDETRRHNSILDKIVKRAQESDSSARRIGDKISYKGSVHDLQSIKKSDLQIHKIHQTENETAIGFLGELSPLSISTIALSKSTGNSTRR